jgi:hypothetical protein
MRFLQTTSVLALTLVSGLITLTPAQSEQEGERPDTSTGLVHDVRQATERFHDVTIATAAGYVSAGSCESGPNEGAMGIHYVNGAFVDDGVLDVQRPEVLVYEPRAGRLQRVAVEFFVDAQQWDAANAAPPVLGGQLFHYAGAPNHLRLPPHYQLHVWAWKSNPNGSFSDWNPQVSCVEYTGEAERPGSGH